MAMRNPGSREISEETWDKREHDWTGKSFYFVNVTFIFGNALGLDNKLEELNRDIRQNGYKVKNPMVLIQLGKFKGKVMIEVEKKDQYDAAIHTYDISTMCDTVVHIGGVSSLGKSVDRLKERVAARRSRDPREMFYLYQPDSNSPKTVVFALT